MSRGIQTVQSNVHCYDTILASDDEFYTPQSNPSYTHIPSVELKSNYLICQTTKPADCKPADCKPEKTCYISPKPALDNQFNVITEHIDCASSRGVCTPSPYRYVSAAGSETSLGRISTPVNDRPSFRNVSLIASCESPSRSNHVTTSRVNPVGINSFIHQSAAVEPPCSNGGVASADSSSRLHGVCQISNTIIKEKDLLIERQKLKRYQLEQRVRELEGLVRKLTVANEQYTNQSLTDIQLQTEEQKYKAISSSVRLMSEGNELYKALLAKSQLEHNLGELEKELADLKCYELTTRSTHERKLNLLNSQLESYRKRERELEEGKFDADQQAESCAKELNRLKAYLADLPTKDEYNQTCQSSEDLKQQNNARIETIDKLRIERNHGNREREELVSELAETRVQINQLLHEVNRLNQENEGWIQGDIERRGANPDDIMALRTANGELVERLHELQREFSDRDSEFQRKIIEMESHIAELEESLERRNSHIDKLDVELEQANNDYDDLHNDYTEFRERYDDLEQKLSMNKCDSETVSRILSSETTQLQQSVVEKVVYAINSLDSLMNLYNNRDEFNLPDLLSLKPASVRIATPKDHLVALKAQNDGIDELNKKLGSIHQQLIDGYADDMASSGHIECATQ